MEKSSWKASSRSVCQKIHRVWRNPKIHCHVTWSSVLPRDTWVYLAVRLIRNPVRFWNFHWGPELDFFYLNFELIFIDILVSSPYTAYLCLQLINSASCRYKFMDDVKWHFHEPLNISQLLNVINITLFIIPIKLLQDANCCTGIALSNVKRYCNAVASFF